MKYRQYQEAVYQALCDLPDRPIVVMVVGAGRGPLVRRSLAAAKAAKRTIRVFAVEKNPNAVITLRNMVRTEHMDNVTVVASDMRVWEAPEKADVLVSELLGSWGDNELSPECLDGAQKFLKRACVRLLSCRWVAIVCASPCVPALQCSAEGISIPYKYTSYVEPVMTSKLWNDVKAYKELKKFETSYVVKLYDFMALAKAKPCFTFEHPNRAARIDNTRYAKINFTASISAVMHGLAGYFEAWLYKDVMISA